MLSGLFVSSKKTTGGLLAGAVLVLFSWGTKAYDGKPQPLVANEAPKELAGIGITEQLGTQLDLSVKVKDENGQEVPLKSFFDGRHPVIISPVYYACPGLCNFHLNGLTDALKLMEPEWSVGKKFKVLAVSFDSKETPEVASPKKDIYMKLYGREGAAQSWHFVTANEQAVQAITKQIGFNFKWDEKAQEWAHASAAIITTPDGKISRYLHGIMFEPKDIKLALNEATEGKIGNFVEHLVLYCFKYDPQQSKYTLAAFNVMKLGAAVMVLMMVLWLLPVYIRSRKAKSKSAGR